MKDDIQKLISSLRLGDYEDPTEKIGLLSAALVEQPADLGLLLSLIRAPQIPLRLAAIEASRDRREPELLSELVALVRNPEVRIRQKLADVLGQRTEQAAIETLTTLAQDREPDVRTAMIKATAGRPEFRAVHENCLANDSDWNARYAAVQALEELQGPLVVKALALALQDDDTDVGRRCAEIIEKRLSEFPEGAEAELPVDIAQVSRIESRLKGFGNQRFHKFLSWIQSQASAKVDPETLGRFGTDLTLQALKGTLPRAYYVEETCQTILNLLKEQPPRSMALVGPAGIGKSALVNELVYRLAQPENGNWHVLRVSPADFLAGTKYIGEWESKLHDLIEAIRRPRHVLLYVPNLSDLSAVGSTSKSDSNVATALAPYLEDGSVVVLGETAPEEFERGLGKIPSLRRLFEKVLLLEPDPDRTRNILAAIRDEAHSRISNELLDQLLELSTQFLSHVSRPGNAVYLLRAVIKNEKESGRLLTFRDILHSLSGSTGIPADLLDDSIPLNQGDVRQFFESRIIGQGRAVEAVVDLVTLIKAGVTDPNRPFGVFMFVGPTGVGKTELARALAEFIFGDTSRLKRFDMSEFANQEGFTRLIGTQYENGLLTDAVRQHPFSVVLLDEIEKSHINVFDLCLQLFDAGRLTDGRGRTVDFRRTIIVLTSNVGATTGLMGFGSAEPERASRSPRDKVPRELSRFFRPEFLNRLDRIIQFQPLSPEVADQIARREIQSVLQRSGIRRRQLVVDVDPSVVSLVVREGYSKQLGARPLKRTVERLLLLPLARAIAGGSLQERTILRLTQQGGRVQATITEPPTTKRTILTEHQESPGTRAARLADLHARYAAIDGSIQALAARKSDLIAQTRDPAFSRNAEMRMSVLNDIHNLDQFLSLHERTGKAVNAISEDRSRDSSKSVETTWRENVERLEREVAHLAFVARCEDATELGDALLTISLVDRSGEAQEAVQKIAGMYQALAARRRMTAEVLGEFYSGTEDHAYLLIAGLAAYGLLKHESGLHQVDRRYKHRAVRSNREVMREDRELLRVEVRPAPHEPSKQFQQQVKSRIIPLKPARKRLLKGELAVKLFHEPSLRSVEFWAPGPRESAVTRGLLILSACLRDRPENHSNGIVRHYDLGIGPKIKDTRTGRVTTRVRRVLKGDLETLLDLNS